MSRGIGKAKKGMGHEGFKKEVQGKGRECLSQGHRQAQDMEWMLIHIKELAGKYAGYIGGMPGCFMDDALDHESIIMDFINTGNNKSFLSGIPRMKFLDLSIIYRVIIEEGEGQALSVAVDNSMMKQMGLDCNRLHKIAYANTVSRYPLAIMKKAECLYIMTNERGMHGAAVMAYGAALEEMAARAGGSFYIIPCSVHELGIVPEGARTVQCLSDALKKSNQMYAGESLMLSKSIYYYDHRKKQVRIAATYGEEQG